MSHLHFTGLWNPALAFLVGSCLAAAAWGLYRRELSLQTDAAKLLPWLRAGAIFLLTQMLAGPVIKYRETVGRMTRLAILVDSSRSMGLTDPDMEGSRKDAIARQLGTMPASDRQQETFDMMSRTDRARTLLFEGGSESLVSSLLPNFEVELISIEDSRARRLWSSKNDPGTIPTSLPPPTFERTDLASALAANVEGGAQLTDSEHAQRTVLVLLSDGNHNAPSSASSIAKQLGDRDIPAFCVGFGATNHPPDLAVQKIETPESVFKSDRIKGQIFVKDDMPPGVPFNVQILHAGTIAWEQHLVTSGQHVRPVKFDIPVVSLLTSGGETAPESSTTGQPIQLNLEALIITSAAERQTLNNSARTTVAVLSSKRKMLLLEGRPRWETRYLRNLFERDPQWEVNALFFDSTQPGTMLPRGLANGSFPSSRSNIMEYEIVVIGEWNSALLSNEELEWLGDFVSTRGGGLLLIDGARSTLQTMLGRPSAPLLPVSFNPPKESAAAPLSPERLSLTQYAKNIPALALVAGTSQQSEIWETLPAPRWMADCKPLPGSEVLVEAAQGQSLKPALVQRRYGAGRILYCASDETWRWRNNVAGMYQERFWSQVVTWLAAQPLAVQTTELSLDAGGFVFKEGASANLRVFIDPKNKPLGLMTLGSSTVTGTLWRNGNRIASIPLTREESRDGFFSATSAPLQEGQYEFTVEGGALSNQAKEVRAPFIVLSEAPNEITEITQNEALLRQIAAESKGQYLPEESIHTLKNLLAPWRDGESRMVEIPIWQGLPWFSVIILLLSAEWWLRKRLGLI